MWVKELIKARQHAVGRERVDRTLNLLTLSKTEVRNTSLKLWLRPQEISIECNQIS
jgi:hypothetical protein